MVEPQDVRDARASSVSECQPRSPAAPAACSEEGAPKVRPPSPLRAILISVPWSLAFQATTTSGTLAPERACSATRGGISPLTRPSPATRSPHGRTERGAFVAAGRDEDVALAVGGRAPGHGHDGAVGRDPRRRVRVPRHGQRHGPRRLCRDAERHRGTIAAAASSTSIDVDQSMSFSLVPGPRSRQSLVQNAAQNLMPNRQLPAARIADGGDLVEVGRRTASGTRPCRSWRCAPFR